MTLCPGANFHVHPPTHIYLHTLSTYNAVQYGQIMYSSIHSSRGPFIQPVIDLEAFIHLAILSVPICAGCTAQQLATKEVFVKEVYMKVVLTGS